VQVIAAQFTTSSAPWWFVAALAGALSLAAALASAVVAFLSTRASDRRKAEYEDARLAREETRLDHAELRRAAARFLVECRQYVKDFQASFEQDRTSGTLVQRLVADARPNDVRPAYDAYWDLVFLANNEIGEAARELMKATRRFQLTKLGPPGSPSPLSHERFSMAYDAHIEARRKLVDSVMRALGRQPA